MTDVATLDGSTRSLDGDALVAFAERLRGPLLTPDDGDFAEATRIWNGMVERTPALVVQPTGTADVVAAVDFAREHDLLLSVKGGGHHIGGNALADGGLTLDMSSLRGVVVDPDARTVTAQAGCLLGDIDRETQLHGLATPLGFVSKTGIAGLTLGGGFGYLTRRFGWTVDNLLEVEIVTADGEVRRASREEHPDLFWAVRGAGHNLGVVTRFTYRLFEVGPTVFGGLIAWPGERVAEVLEAYRSLTTEAPRELTAFLMVLRAPPAPFVPDSAVGQQVVGMTLCYTGDSSDVDAVLAPIRSLGTPVVDLLGEQPFTRLQSYLDDTNPDGLHYYWKTEFTDALTDDLLATLGELADGCPLPLTQLVVAHVGGAINEREPDDGAVGNRDVRFIYGVSGEWEPDDPDAADHEQWVRDAWERLRGYSTGGNYINFQTAEDGEERVRSTYGDNYDRLVEVKTRYDPDNRFRVNRNVRPRVPAKGD